MFMKSPERIPLFRPVIREPAVDAVTDVLRSGWLGPGKNVQEFERAFADYIGAPGIHCVGLNSCTSALHLALRLLDLPPGSEIVTTPLTFVATNHPILYERCTPIFADIQADTGNLDVSAAAKKITEKTKAIILMHYGGYPCDLDEFYSLAETHGIPIVEDCAHASGAAYKGRRIGSHGQLHAFSFHATKNLAIGTGGALIVRSDDFRDRLKRLRWLGISSDTYQRMKDNVYTWSYDVQEVGYNYQMDDIHAAIGLAQLPFLDDDNARRRDIAGIYRDELSHVPGISLLRYEDDRNSSYLLFPILAEEREQLLKKLRAGGIDASVHYRRNDTYPMYEEQDLPQAESFSRSVISLPMHILLTDDQVSRVTTLIREGW
jgi:perosamine synthetase